MKTYIMNKWIFSIVAVSLFSLVGMSFLLMTQAATPTASIEPESGTKTSSISMMSDTTASGGSAVKFGSGSAGIIWPESYYTGPAGRNNILPPKKGVLVGIHDGGEAQIIEREAQSGRMFDIGSAFYQGYVINFDGKISWMLNRGMIPFISYIPPNVGVSGLLSGAADSSMRESARAVAALKPARVMMRAYHEFSGSWMWYYSNNPEDIKAYWKRTVDIFKSEGATNISWVYTPDEGNNRDLTRAAYPGDNYVDWIGSDSYNWYPAWAGYEYGWISFAHSYCWQKFDPVHATDDCIYNSFPNKPFMAAEFGTVEHPDYSYKKAEWISSLKTDIPQHFDHMHALVYFDWNYDRDWRLNTSQSSIDSWKNLVHDPYFNTYSR